VRYFCAVADSAPNRALYTTPSTILQNNAPHRLSLTQGSMDDSSITECDAESSGPILTSVLGIKGPLRYRPHHYTQRAHVILRRVEFSDDSSDEGEDNGIVYFSLFAHKRIDVKPGKEILLTVADGKLKDKPILLQGVRADFEDSKEEGEDSEVVDVPKEEPAPPVPAPTPVVPPKMRRAWTKKNEEVSPNIREFIDFFS
jgi:hypothetical protein